ncbi:hypothetical protein PFISCL1PPCAC_18353, partial [Pristionchus fissidentatus]
MSSSMFSSPQLLHAACGYITGRHSKLEAVIEHYHLLSPHNVGYHTLGLVTFMLSVRYLGGGTIEWSITRRLSCSSAEWSCRVKIKFEYRTDTGRTIRSSHLVDLNSSDALAVIGTDSPLSSLLVRRNGRATLDVTSEVELHSSVGVDELRFSYLLPDPAVRGGFLLDDGKSWLQFPIIKDVLALQSGYFHGLVSEYPLLDPREDRI